MCCGPRLLSSFTFLHGPRHTNQPGRSLYEGGISSRGLSLGQAFHTHKAYTQVLGSLHIGGLVCLLQSSLLAVLYTRPRDVGGIFLPWGRGLIFFIEYSRKPFTSNRSIRVPKSTELYADSKSEEKIEKKWTKKTIFKN